MCTTSMLPFHPFYLFPISSLSLPLTRSSGFPSGPGLTPVPADGQLGATDGQSEDMRWWALAYLWITSPEKSSWSPIHAAGRAGCLIRASDAGCDHHAFQIQKTTKVGNPQSSVKICICEILHSAFLTVSPLLFTLYLFCNFFERSYHIHFMTYVYKGRNSTRLLC